MPLVSSKEMLLYAMKNKFAIGAFNANNLETTQAIIKAAEEEEAPVIVQISQGAIKYVDEKSFYLVVKSFAEKSKIPVVCHLDHGLDFDTVIKSLRAGFTSLMFDGSDLPFDENIKLTKQLVQISHSAGIPLEGEIGKVPDAEKKVFTYEEIKKYLTTPEEAQEFYEKTNVDSLAISVGNAHRMRVKTAILDIERIHNIFDRIKIPLVLHGASGISNENIQQAIQAGICKVNFATELNKAFTTSIRNSLTENPSLVDIRIYGKSAKEKVKEVVKEKIRVLNSNGKAYEVLKYINNCCSN